MAAAIKGDIAGRGSHWISANEVIPPHGFNYDTGQCIGRGICNEDEVEALRVVSAGNCDWQVKKMRARPTPSVPSGFERVAEM